MLLKGSEFFSFTLVYHTRVDSVSTRQVKPNRRTMRLLLMGILGNERMPGGGVCQTGKTDGGGDFKRNHR